MGDNIVYIIWNHFMGTLQKLRCESQINNIIQVNYFNVLAISMDV